ncbi:hypothetical protein PG996_010667 [Apiospora saccharicola]|uniref:Uncharacterized protein n=1 Tax=Apiospora saccharicola TaxID=335842 RepID=A0ABR1UP88_9PEZI
MQDASPASHYTAHHGETSRQGSVLYGSISSIHSRGAEDIANVNSHAVNGSGEATPRHTGHRIAQNRPDDLDSLQEPPSDREDNEDDALDYNSESQPINSLRPLPTSWQPLWLRRPTLIAMAVSLVLLAAVILGLYIISVRKQGLGPSASTDVIVFLWKYLPTTAIVVLLSAWNGIDFSTRLLQPWANLREGPTTVDTTLFLDLLTPIVPVMLWTASKVRAWPSILTIATVLILDIIRVLSTGLLQVDSVSLITHDVQLQKPSTFDASKWDPKVTNTAIATIYHGVWAQKLSWPDWTSSNITLEPISPPETTGVLSSFTSYSGITRGFFPDMDCEEASIDGGIRISKSSDYMANITFKAPSCSVQVNLPLLDSTQVFKSGFHSKNPDRSFVGKSQFVACPDQSRRYLATVTLVDSSMKLLRYSSLFCRPSYYVQNITVEVPRAGNRPKPDWSTLKPGTGQFDNLDAMDLLSSLVRSTGTFSSVKQPNKTTVNNDPFLRAASVSLLRDDVDTIYLEPFLDPKVMADHIRDAFTGMASIAVHSGMLGTVQEQTKGTLTHDEARVRVPAGTAFPVFGLLVLCALLSLLLLRLRPHAVVPRDPRSIGGTGIILHNCVELQRRCRLGMQQLYRSTQEAKLSSFASSGAKPKFLVKIDDSSPSGKRRPSTSAPAHGQDRWQPIVFKIWCRPLAVIIPLLLVAVLEYIQRLSDKSGGFVAIPQTTTAHYLTTIIPALVMWAISALYGSINFNTLFLSPYQAMAEGGAGAHRGFLSHNLGRLPLVTLLISLRDNHTAACFSAMGTILGSFLTIVITGLYSVANLETQTTMTLQRTDSFGVNWSGSPLQDNGAGQALSLIVWQNLSDPQWTHDDLVFPNLALSKDDVDVAKPAGAITVTVPARRAVLDCDITEPGKVTVGIISNYSSAYTVFTEVRSRCPGSTGNPIATRLMSTDSNMTGFGGQLGSLWETANITDGGPIVTNHLPPANEPGCHSLIFYYGSFPSEIPKRRGAHNLSTSDAQVTTLACTQLIQEVDVTLSLLLPTDGGPLIIDPSRAPVADEGSARFVNAGTPEASNVQEYLVAYPLSNFFKPVTTEGAVLRSLGAMQSLSWFYQAVVLANEGLDPGDLVGSNKTPRLVEATSKMYGRYMAQVMHRVMRSPDTKPPPSQRALPAVATQAQTRLRQNRGPKIALQLLLGLMSACTLAGWLAMRDTKLLPHEPGSIAGVATLVAGSGLWGDGHDESAPHARALVPEGAEWTNDKELTEKARWDGVSFGFGSRADGLVGVNIVHRRQTPGTSYQEQESLGDPGDKIELSERIRT